jgi:hypothetical protein
MLRVRATRNTEGDVMVAVTEQQQEAQEESPKADSETTAITPSDGVKQASADHGPDLLPDMEHLVWLVRKIKNIPLLRRLLRNEGVHVPEKLVEKMEKAKGVLPPTVRKSLYPLVGDASSVTRQRLERIAERIEILGDEYGKQAVLSLFDEGDEADAAVLARPCDPHGRSLYLYLEQEYPEKHRPGGKRFDQAERVQVMNRQWRSEAYSSHYRGPLGPTPKLDEAMQERIKERILLLYPNAPRDDVIIEQFSRRDLGHAHRHDEGEDDDPAKEVLDTMTVTFNGAEVHYPKVEHGEEVSHDDLAALSIRFSREPATGALSVFSDDREIRRDLAAIFRDVVLAADGAIEDMPMLEFDLSAFVSPTVLAKLVSERIEGIERIDIQHLKVACPSLRKTHDEAGDREIVQELKSMMTIQPDRRDDRNIYEVARQDYRNPDLSVYVPAQIKLVMRMAKQRHRKAHKVAVQVTAPNGFNDRSKTEDDRKLVMAQLEKLGMVVKF